MKDDERVLDAIKRVGPVGACGLGAVEYQRALMIAATAWIIAQKL